MIRHLLQAWDRWVHGARACSACGCTDRYACANRCWWIGPYRCSNCSSATTRRLWEVG